MFLSFGICWKDLSAKSQKITSTYSIATFGRSSETATCFKINSSFQQEKGNKHLKMTLKIALKIVFFILSVSFRVLVISMSYKDPCLFRTNHGVAVPASALPVK